MKKKTTSKEALLATARSLVEKNGLSKLTIRQLATAAGLSVGTVYNYFPSKEALVEDVVRSVWLQAFHGHGQRPPEDFFATLTWVYDRMLTVLDRYPGLMASHDHRSLLDNSPRLQEMHTHIERTLVKCLTADPRWAPVATKTGLAPDQVVHFALIHLKYAASDRRPTCADLVAILEALLKEDSHAESPDQ